MVDVMLGPKRIVVFVLLFAIVAVYAVYHLSKPIEFKCDDRLGCVSYTLDQPIKIGVMQALTGGPAIIGNTQVNMIKLVVQKHNGKLLDHPIRLHIEDEKCSAAGGTTAALKFVSDPKILAVIGPTCSGAAVTAGKIISDSGMILLSGTASSPYLTSIGDTKGQNWQPGFYRTISNAANMGKAAALFAFNRLGIKKAAVIDDGDAYTKGNKEFFIQSFEKLGGQVVLNSTINKGETNMIPILRAVANSEAEFLFFPIFMPEGMYLAKQRNQLGMENVVFLGMGALLNNKFIEFVGNDGVGTYLVIPSPPPKSAEHDQLISDFRSLHGHPPKANLYGYAYDAAELLYQTMEAIAVKEKDGTLHFGRQQLRDALYATKNFKGVTGTITCNQFGDMGAPFFDIIQLDDPEQAMGGFKSNVVYQLLPKDFH